MASAFFFAPPFNTYVIFKVFGFGPAVLTNMNLDFTNPSNTINEHNSVRQSSHHLIYNGAYYCATFRAFIISSLFLPFFDGLGGRLLFVHV